MKRPTPFAPCAGDFVYRGEADPGTEEHPVFRCRLVLPGER